MSNPDDTQRILRIIHATIDELNAQLPAGKRIVPSAATVLVGEQSPLDSLGLINFVTTLEGGVADAFQKPVKLLQEELMVDAKGPLATIGALADYIARQIAA